MEQREIRQSDDLILTVQLKRMRRRSGQTYERMVDIRCSMLVLSPLILVFLSSSRTRIQSVTSENRPMTHAAFPSLQIVVLTVAAKSTVFKRVATSSTGFPVSSCDESSPCEEDAGESSLMGDMVLLRVTARRTMRIVRWVKTVLYRPSIRPQGRCGMLCSSDLAAICVRRGYG
jgi:hypothetical protein